MGKSDSFGFLRENVIIEEMIVGSKINMTEHFSKSAC